MRLTETAKSTNVFFSFNNFDCAHYYVEPRIASSTKLQEYDCPETLHR